MPRQITDLPEYLEENVAENDLLIVRDYKEKKDKKLKFSILRRVIDFFKAIDVAEEDKEYLITRGDNGLEIKQYHKPYEGFSGYIVKTSSGRTTNASTTRTAIGVAIPIENNSDKDIIVGVMITSMIQCAAGVHRTLIDKQSGDGEIVSKRSPYVDGFNNNWREYFAQAEVKVPAGGTAVIRAYIQRESGTQTATVCDQANDANSGYGVYAQTWFEKFIED